jgi:hypothetical protein
MVSAYNPSYLEAEVGEFWSKASPTQRVRTCLKKYLKQKEPNMAKLQSTYSSCMIH